MKDPTHRYQFSIAEERQTDARNPFRNIREVPYGRALKQFAARKLYIILLLLLSLLLVWFIFPWPTAAIIIAFPTFALTATFFSFNCNLFILGIVWQGQIVVPLSV